MYGGQGIKREIINLTIVECKCLAVDSKRKSKSDNKSNHSGM